MQTLPRRKAAVTLLLLAALLSLALWSVWRVERVETFFPAVRGERLLLIDPGHGGEDGGAVSAAGAKESEINLAIALCCDQLAGLTGTPVQLLRTEDRSLAGADAQSLREKKREDLMHRVETVNAAQDAVLLSIHQNSFPDAAYSGAQVFYRPERQSEAWALATQSLLRQAVDPANARQAKEIPSDIYLMSHINCPAILVECGFLSHPEEAERLCQPSYQRRLSVSILAAYLSWSSAGPDI